MLSTTMFYILLVMVCSLPFVTYFAAKWLYPHKSEVEPEALPANTFLTQLCESEKKTVNALVDKTNKTLTKEWRPNLSVCQVSYALRDECTRRVAHELHRQFVDKGWKVGLTFNNWGTFVLDFDYPKPPELNKPAEFPKLPEPYKTEPSKPATRAVSPARLAVYRNHRSRLARRH